MSMNLSGEYQNKANLQALIPDVTTALCKVDNILGPYTQVTQEDLAENKINVANEIQTDHSLLDTAWIGLLKKLSSDKNQSQLKRNPSTILSGQDELEIRQAILEMYSGKKNSQMTNPLVSFYQEASQDLEGLTEHIENSGVYSRQVQGFDQAGDATWYRVLSRLPLYTPRITSGVGENSNTQFILPLEKEPTLDAQLSPFSEMIGKYGLRGIDEKYYLVVQDEEMNSQLANTILSSPNLTRLFLAEELALHQEDLIHNLRSRVTKISERKLPDIEAQVNSINNLLRIATFKQFDTLLSENNKLYITVPETDPEPDHKVLAPFEISRYGDSLMFEWREETGLEEVPFIPHKTLVKVSPDENELLFNINPSDKSRWTALRSPRNDRLNFSEVLFNSIKFVTQTEFDNMKADDISHATHDLQKIIQDRITPDEFFGQLGPLRWGYTDDTSYDRRLIVSTQPVVLADI